MADRIRVLLVGDTRAMREGRGDLEAAGLRVTGEVSSPAEIAGGESADVLLVADDRWLDDIADAWGERPMPAIVVVTRDDRIASELGALGLPGWAIVAPDSSSAELIAGLVAAGRGFAARPASRHADADDEEYGRIDALTTREREVLELVSQGLPNKAIASRLGVSDQTVKFHLSSIFSKLGVSSRTEAVRRGVRAGLIDL
jgi:DNA-binding NarL/FixJ family response regulator